MKTTLICAVSLAMGYLCYDQFVVWPREREAEARRHARMVLCAPIQNTTPDERRNAAVTLADGQANAVFAQTAKELGYISERP